MALPVHILLGQMEPWEAVAGALEEAAGLRRTVATEVGEVIFQIEKARVTLQESAALLQESADAVEILYDNLLNLAPHSSATLRQAGMLVDALFNGPGPLTGAIAAAENIVASHFDSPPPSGGPLQDARRHLGFLFDSVHGDHVRAGSSFNYCANRLGIVHNQAGAGTWVLWRISHGQAGTQGSQAEQRVNDAVLASIAAHDAHRLCRAQSARGRPREYILEAERTLQRTITDIDAALVILRDLTNNLAALEVLVHNATATIWEVLVYNALNVHPAWGLHCRFVCTSRMLNGRYILPSCKRQAPLHQF